MTEIVGVQDLHGYGLLCAAAALLTAFSLPTRAESESLDLDAVLAPVIALEAHIPPDARSVTALGTVRGGSGVVIDGAGLVLTIGYLVLEAASVDLLPEGLEGRRLPGDVVAWDHHTGLGLIRAREPLDVTPMPLGDSASLQAGDAVIAASWERREGLVPSVVVDRRDYAGYWEYLLEDALYVAPLHPAFPGAALVDLDGRLAGIGGFALFDSFEEEETAGAVFVPINALKPVLAELLLHSRSGDPRPWLGLYCEETDDGLRVRRVPEGGPASQAGIRPGDRVLAVAGTVVDTLPTFYRRLWSAARPGDRVALELRRAGDRLTVEVEAGDRYEFLRTEGRSR